MNGREWTAKDLRELRRLYPHRSTAKVARQLSRSICSVNGAAGKLGLHKTPEYLKSPDACRLRRGDEVGKPFRFGKGHVPANKGVRQPGWAPGRMKETQFKKGTRNGAANNKWKPVGSVVVNSDGYLKIKVADEPEEIAGKGSRSTNWQFVHRQVWEAANGPVPRGHRLWWKDGDHLNCAIENLELLTDKQHMARTTIHNLHPELKETIRMVSRVKRAIKKREKQSA